MKYCLQCNNEIPKHKKFCNSSCAAKYNNSRRKHSDETKTKISKIAKEKNFAKNFENSSPINRSNDRSAVYFNTCKVCKKLFTVSSQQKDKKCCSKECFQKQDGGYRENSVKGNGEWVVDSFGNETYLQSSYEIRCMQSLNENNIKWLRPKSLPYQLTNENKTRNYYPDFYLPDFDVYLDPKNDYLINKDYMKIKSVRDQNNVNILILSEFYLKWENLKEMI